MSYLNVSSREKLDMDLNTANNQSNHQGTFDPGSSQQDHKPKGVFIKRWTIISMLFIAVACIVGVGILAVFFSPRICAYHHHDSLLSNCSSNSNLPFINSSPDTSNSSSNRKPYVRLPKSVIPEHYDVELQTFIGPNDFYFDGNVTIAIKCIYDSSNITLHTNDLKIYNETVSLKDDQGNSIVIKNFSHNFQLQFFVIQLSEMLIHDRMYHLGISFRGNLNDDLAGFYRSSYINEKGEKRWLAVTQFQPTDARRTFPCFDEPSMKASFNITLIHYKNMTAISNMPMISSIPRGEWLIDKFQRTVKMSTYLLAFVVSDFEMISNHSAKFTVWSRDGSIESANYSLQVGPKMLQFYEKYFNIPYPLPKTDMVAVPDFNAGAMENWGLIIFRETALLYDPIMSSASNLQRIAIVVSHELAHQWFGNLVTPKWWDDLWLNEGFASYMQYECINSVHPKWEMFQQFVVDEIHDVFELDSLTTSHQISVPVHDPDEINEIFDHISYGKGASIIRMMDYFLGRNQFRKGVSNYLNSFRYDNAAQNDLWAFLSKSTNNSINVKKVMDSWTLQVGYPVVTLTRNYKDKKASLSQKRFLLADINEIKQIDLEKYTWEIPITYTDSRNPSWEPITRLWMHQSLPSSNVSIPDGNVPDNNQWMIVNTQQVGYYRVNYDIDNWKLIVNQLLTNHTKIHTINRAQIIDDSMDLARAGLLDYHIGLNTTKYLINEKEFVPWEAATNAFNFLDNMLRRSESYGLWRSYVLSLIKNLYNELGWSVSPSSEDLLNKYTQSNVLAWACKYGLDDCIKTSLRQFTHWKNLVLNNSTINPIHPNLRSIVYCTGIEHGNEHDWDFVWGQYASTSVASEKDKLLRALACSREPWLLTRYIIRAFNSSSGIRKQDGSFVFRTVASTNSGRDIAFNYFRDQWDLINNYYGKSFFSFGNLIKTVSSSLKTQFELEELLNFYEKVKDNLGTAQRSFKQAIEKTQANVYWMKHHYPKLESWLKHNAMSR